MTNFLEFRIDKFIFRIADDRSYTAEGLWVMQEGEHVRIGISDYTQQRSGDVAFVEVKPVGTVMAAGDELAVIETIKVNLSFGSPVAGTVTEVNPILEMTPEAINQDPYGMGWLAVMDLENSEAVIEHLLDPQSYYFLIKKEAEQDIGSK